MKVAQTIFAVMLVAVSVVAMTATVFAGDTLPTSVLPQPRLLAQFGMWGVYIASPGGKKHCFVLAKATTSESSLPLPNRKPVFMFITTRPADKVTNEISLNIGYAASKATAQIAGSSFALYTQEDGAWIKNRNEEVKMLNAMRGADNAVIKGISAKGTQSIDTFTLQGLGQALDRTDQECDGTFNPQESADNRYQQIATAPQDGDVPLRGDKIDPGRIVVQLKDDGGVFVVPVEINGTITLDFVIDSGASDVSVPADVVSVLMRTHTIRDSDFVGKQTVVLADGSEAPSTIFMIRSLKIGGHRIENVRGSIAPPKGSLLLGLSFLKNFKSWSIDNSKHALVLE
jgi:clan AA aspartic protease (TIGR02281 family)